MSAAEQLDAPPAPVASAPATKFRALSWVQDALVMHTSVGAALEALRAGHTTWIDLGGRSVENETLLSPSGLDIHPLIVEDIFGDCQRPKIEDYDNYLYLLFHAPAAEAKDTEPDTLDLTEIDILVGKSYVLTHHSQSSPALDVVWGEIVRSSRAIKKTPAHVAHAVLDRVVDDYVPLLDRLDEEIDVLEREVLADTGEDVLQRIFTLKRQLQQLRRVSIHQKEVLYRLSRGEFDEIPETLIPFFRDIYDHFVRVTDLAESYRDLIAGTFEAHLSVQSNKMNAIMKTLTLATTVFMPLTFIAGVYGMNFEHMPELKKPWGYYACLAVMVVVALGVLVFYRRRKWL